MSNYPTYLRPLADSGIQDGTYTKQAIFYTYDLFIEQQISEGKIVKDRNNNLTVKAETLTETPDNQLLKFILEDQTTIPYSLFENPIPATKFAERFLNEIKTLWKLTPKELEKISSKHNPISYNKPRTITPVPKHFHILLQTITEDPRITYETNPQKRHPQINYNPTHSKTLNTALDNKQITQENLEEFTNDFHKGKYEHYITHIPATSKTQLKKEPVTALSLTSGTAYAALISGTIYAYTITPGMGILATILTGAVGAATGISVGVWKTGNNDKGKLALTPSGEQLLKEYQAWHRYKKTT